MLSVECKYLTVGSTHDIHVHILYIFDQTPWVLFFSLLAFVQLLFEGGIYFFGKPADIKDGWIRYVRVRW